MAKKRAYQPQVFDGRVIASDEIERIHKEVSNSSASKPFPIPRASWSKTCGRS